MTAVAQPPNFHSGPRSWNGGQSNINSITADEVTRFFIKGSQRTSGASSVSSSASSSSVASDGSNGVWGNSLNGKKKGTGRGGVRVASNGGWPTKPDIMRAPGGANGHSGSSVSSLPINSMHQTMPILPSQHLMSNGTQVNGGQQPQNNSYLMLQPLNGTFDRKYIPLPYFPETLRIGRQTNAKTIPTQSNGFFDSKVLSRQHAEVWAEKVNGRVWIRDIKSSNGTFVNGQRLSQENRDSEPHELRENDLLELGIDIVGEDNKTIIHHKVAAKVEHAGMQSSGTGSFEVNFGDLDSMGGGSLMNSQMNHVSLQNNSLRGRSGSQGSRSSAMSVSGGMNHRQVPMMIAPVTMEMVVKKLNYEIQVAKQQSQSLQRTTEIYDALLAPKSAEESQTQADSKAGTEELPMTYNSTSALPPPPQLSIWELPRTSSTPSIGFLPPKLKSEKTLKTETPSSLVDALDKARKELELKTALVKDLEDALRREKSAREDAEDRASQLETRALSGISRDRVLGEFEAEKVLADEKGDIDDTETLSGDDDKSLDEQPDMQMNIIHSNDDTLEVKVDPSALAAAEAANRLQRRVEEMMLELQSAKAEIEAYKRRTESAEEESRTTRKTLAEMVESIRKEEEARKSRKRQSGSQTDPTAMRNSGIQANTDGVSEDTMDSISNGTVKQKDIVKLPNGTRMSSEDLARTSLVLSKRNAAPYVSIFGVMLIGVGLMAVMNSWQKGER
ncbi:hypothetical protein DFP73DRAFT_545603 [Morchella snyderi]|nr:hypothetical protein DFP73DRAFT_545603 [Morchella snyderi]